MRGTSKPSFKKRLAFGIILSLITIAGLPLGVYAVQNIFTGFGRVTDIQYGGANINQVVYQGEVLWERCTQPVQTAQRFNYTGAAQTFTAPCDGYYQTELWGAAGGNVGASFIGGKGGYTSGKIYLQKGETVYFYVGGTPGTGMTGGWNGASTLTQPSYGRPGGGATDMRLVNGAWNNSASLRSRIMVSGGGGGAGNRGDAYGDGHGGVGGGLTGGTAVSLNYSNGWGHAYGTGGTQTSGGSMITVAGSAMVNSNIVTGAFGYVTQTGFYTDSNIQAGGASGYYGGGNAVHGAGGGGSSYISGHTGAVAITSAANQAPKSGCTTGNTNNACSVHYSGKTFSNTRMVDGSGYTWTNVKGGLMQMPNPNGGNYASGTGHPGNGVAKITYLGFDI